MKKIGVLISGGGTNLQALIDKQGTVLKSGKIVCVCSNNSKAYGLERAKNAGIATKVIRKNADAAVITMRLPTNLLHIRKKWTLM